MRATFVLAITVLSAHVALAQEPLGLRLGSPTTQFASAQALSSTREAPDRVVIESDAILFSDGRLEGHAVTRATGASADLLKRFLTPLLDQPLSSVSDMLITRQLLVGTLDALEPEFGTEQSGITARFSLKPTTNREGARALLLQPGPRFVKPAYVNLVTHLREKVPGPAACPHQSVQQRSRIHLPQGYPELVLPPDISIQLGTTSYLARYRREGDVLYLERSLLVDAGHPVCSVDKLKEIAPVIHAAAHDFNRRITLP